MIEIKLRKAENNISDRNALIEVEKKSTPNLQYVPHVFDMFTDAARGEFCIAEVEGDVVGCAKFTVTPNESAWVETLRVIPERQGLGIGKRLYKRFFEIAEKENVSTMRMYTGINNAVSKGLAEHFGFKLENKFLSASRQLDLSESGATDHSFKLVSNPKRAAEIMMLDQARWNNFLVMNRTFYKLTPALCSYLAQHGSVYEDTKSGSCVVIGARFMPKHAMHLGHFSGDDESSVQFAVAHALNNKIPEISCLYPDDGQEISEILMKHQFLPNASKFIVMRVDL